jgi:cytochrome c556
MTMRPILLLLLPLAACATTTATPAPAPGLTQQQIVAARQSAFHLSGATLGGLKPVVDAGGDVKPLTFAARGLARWARTLPAMFPEGTQAGTRAKPEIWQNRADFEAKAAAYAAAADRLVAAAGAGDKAAFATHYAAVRESCNACHDPYRAEPAR